jgi:hypothetical protein
MRGLFSPRISVRIRADAVAERVFEVQQSVFKQFFQEAE